MNTTSNYIKKLLERSEKIKSSFKAINQERQSLFNDIAIKDLLIVVLLLVALLVNTAGRFFKLLNIGFKADIVAQLLNYIGFL